MYDKYKGVPRANSPLESLFILVYVQRQEAQLLQTQAIVHAVLQSEGDERKEAVETFDKYCERMFPFWKKAVDKEADEERKALMDLVKKPLRIRLPEVFKMQAAALEQRRARSPSAPKRIRRQYQ